MKKKYNSPVAEFVDFDIDAVMMIISPGGDDGPGGPGGGDGGDGHWNDQAAKEYQGSWSDIWKDM